MVELWRARSGNCLGGYLALKAALEVVRRMVELNGEETLEDLFLEVWGDEDDEPNVLVDGDRLRRLVEDGLAEPPICP